MKKRNIDLLRAERKKNAALRTNIKVLVRECELLKSRMDANTGNRAVERYQTALNLLKQREMKLNWGKGILDAMAIYLADKYGVNGVLRIPGPDMDLLKSKTLMTANDHDSIIVKVMQKENHDDSGCR